MSEKPNEAQRIAGEMTKVILYHQHETTQWLLDRITNWGEFLESLGESGECETCNGPDDGGFTKEQLRNELGKAYKRAERYKRLYLSRLDPVHGSTQDAGEGCGECSCADGLAQAISSAEYYKAKSERLTDPDCETCETRDQWEALNEKVVEMRRRWLRTKEDLSGFHGRAIKLKDDLATANKRIEELRERNEDCHRVYFEASEVSRKRIAELSEGIALEAKWLDRQGLAVGGNRLRALLGEQEGVKRTWQSRCGNCVFWGGLGVCGARDGETGNIKHGCCAAWAPKPDPEPSDALARATEAMNRLPHETVILGRINHLGTAVGAIIYHLKGGKP